MSSLPQIVQTVSYLALPLMLAIVLHEYAHGLVADHFGDDTARRHGRLTMNPLPHIDLFGTIIFPLLCLITGGFLLAWAKPVPVNASQLRDPRRHMALVAAAGPAANLFLAVASALLYGALLSIDQSIPMGLARDGLDARPDMLGMILVPLSVMALYSVLINVLLMVFNLIPIPPLDGGRILTSLLPVRPAMALRRLEPYGMLIIIGLIILDPHIGVIHMITGTLVHLMTGALLAPIVG